MKRVLPVLFVLITLVAISQDTLTARKHLKYLCSEKCFGRGYVKNGLANAEKYLVSELKKMGATPLFGNSYTQSFGHPVNTFPGACQVKVNGHLLRTGIDYLPDPSSPSIKGKFELVKTDSAHYLATKGNNKIVVSLKNKLTYSVGHEVEKEAAIEIKKSSMRSEPVSIEVRIKNKFIPSFESRNIGCFISGSSNTDSLIVITAHYDHLGGIGSKTYFPGANDNASGTSMVLDLIQHYSKTRPRYKTVFLFFAGEEAGLVGSKFFSQNKTLDLTKIKFLINLDLLGTGDDGIMVVNGAIHQKEFELLNRINEGADLVKQIKKRGKAANSDHYWFSEAGVPCFFIYTMGGISAYHDVMDIEKTLPLTDYVDVFKLLTRFIELL